MVVASEVLSNRVMPEPSGGIHELGAKLRAEKHYESAAEKEKPARIDLHKLSCFRNSFRVSGLNFSFFCDLVELFHFALSYGN